MVFLPSSHHLHPKLLDPTWISCTMRPTRRPWTQVIYPASRRPKKVPINRLEAAMALGRSKKCGQHFSTNLEICWRFQTKTTFKKENPNKKGISTRNGSFANKDGHFTSKEDWRSSKIMHHWDLTSKHLGFGPETMGFKSTQSGIYAVNFCISALSASKMRFKLGSSVQHEKRNLNPVRQPLRNSLTQFDKILTYWLNISSRFIPDLRNLSSDGEKWSPRPSCCAPRGHGELPWDSRSSGGEESTVQNQDVETWN